MKKLLVAQLFFYILLNTSTAQILKVKENIQLQDQWCWAACTQTLMNFYGDSSGAASQCEIADFARNKIKWRNFGSDPCCINPSGPCNYWNYMWGDSGSLNGILNYYVKLKTEVVYSALDSNKAKSQFVDVKPFIFRWGWTAGGGHFLVAHGIKDGMLYYMNPWFGEGMKIANYDWAISDPNHKWTHSIIIQTIGQQTDIAVPIINKFKLYPNPSVGLLKIENPSLHQPYEVVVLNSSGQYVFVKNIAPGKSTETLDLSTLSDGMYFVNIKQNGFARMDKFFISR